MGLVGLDDVKGLEFVYMAKCVKRVKFVDMA